MISCKNCKNFSQKKNMCRISGGSVQEETRICKDFLPIPAKRDLDGVFFRVKRDGKWGNVCFSDMTPEEREEVLGDRSAEWWKSLACHLGERLRKMGDQFDIVCRYGEDE